MKNIAFFLFLAGILSIQACKTTKKVDPLTQCTLIGSVKNLQGLDGCDWVIVTEDANALIPIERVFNGIALEELMKIRFGYKKRPEMMSACMAGDIIEITCMEVISKGIPKKEECVNVNNPQRVRWMKKAMDKHRPAEIMKYPYRTDGWAYLFLGKQCFLYDCQGTLLCEKASSEYKDCLKLVMPGSKGQSIWRSEFRED